MIINVAPQASIATTPHPTKERRAYAGSDTTDEGNHNY